LVWENLAEDVSQEDNGDLVSSQAFFSQLARALHEEVTLDQ